jgi:DMSO/TMAO reductase YedYZ molybdopterin-dependent catalytic subunit
VTKFRTSTLLAGAASGLLAAGAGVGASSLVAAFLTGVPSPIFSVGNAAIDLAPPALKDFAVEQFGTADKPLLLGGIATAIIVLAAAAGVIGLRRPRLALAITAVMGMAALLAAATDRTSLASVALTVVPAIVAVVVSVASLAWLLAALARRRRSEAAPWGQAHPGDDVGADFDRRSFLQAALATGAVTVVGGFGSRLFGTAAALASRAGITIPQAASLAGPIPAGTELTVKGITPYLTANSDFYRIDTALTPPDVPADNWSLRIHGEVDTELELSFADLLSRRLVERRITLTCVSNEVGGELAGNATWTGVLLRDLLEEAGVQDGADAVLSTSADDFTAGTPLAALLDGRDAMVAVAMNGEPLPIEHGFPARMVVPGLYGYVSATKWLVDIEVSRFADFTAYWTDRGWDAEAPIKTASRIDVPASFATVPAGTVAVAGVAWAQTRGIRTVEVRADGGTWEKARLATVDSDVTWRQWVYEWQAEAGSHTLEVRATDGAGDTQVSERMAPRPNGATGWHSVTVTVS